MSSDRFKFRVWDDKRKLYTLPGDLSIDADGELWENCTHLDNSDNHLIIEQCTGLRDKNGRLIYEGDVVLALESWSDRKREFNVIYCDKEYGFLFVDNSQNTKALFAFLPEELEIIGNIHEMEREND